MEIICTEADMMTLMCGVTVVVDRRVTYFIQMLCLGENLDQQMVHDGMVVCCHAKNDI